MRKLIFFCLALPMLALLFVPQVDAQQTDGNKLQLPSSNDTMPGVGPVRRYDWFVNLWNKRRAEWAAKADADKGAVVFFGDSITQGWGDDFKGMFAGMKVANRGISGDTTRGMLFRLNEDVLKVQPKAVVMLMGTNDLEEKAEPEMVRDNIKSIVEALNKHDAKMPIIVCLLFPSSETKARPADKIQRINELITAAVANNKQVTLLDTWKPFADDKGNAKPEEFPDLLHPNDAGYSKWAGILKPALVKLGLLNLMKPTNVLESWQFEEHFDGKGTIRVDGEQIVFQTTKQGSENWHVQAYQTRLDLEEGARYELSFNASSAEGRTVYVTAGINEDDWHNIGLFEECYIGKQPDTYKFTFTASDTRKGNNRVGFVLGDQSGSISVSNLNLKKL